jgi:hypothetical protein
MNKVNKKMENNRWKNMNMVEKNKKKDSEEREVEQEKIIRNWKSVREW